MSKPREWMIRGSSAWTLENFPKGWKQYCDEHHHVIEKSAVMELIDDLRGLISCPNSFYSREIGSDDRKFNRCGECENCEAIGLIEKWPELGDSK